MAGEILTGGLSAPSTTGAMGFEGLDYINISHVVGMLECTVSLLFDIGRSNKMRCRVYSKSLGSSTWHIYATHDLDSTDGSTKHYTLSLGNSAWIVAIMPLQNVTRNVNCAIYLKASSNMDTNKNKLLRICNNMKVIISANTASFDTWDYIPNLSTSVNHEMTTSVGTLMQNGQYIFGQN